MRQDAMETAEQYKKAHQRKNRWYKVVTCLAAVVVFCTTYALILPAITMETKCDIQEHTHTESCYTQVTTVTKKVLVCTAESLGIHQHTDACYDSESTLICGYADFVIHRHDASCYDEDGKLWCLLPEMAAHEHTDSCYALPEAVSEEGAEPDLICEEPEVILHQHTSDCFDDGGNLICGKLQVTEHQHTDACFETVEEPADTTTLTCTNTDPGHVHTAMCYGTWELTCGMEEHSHSDACRGKKETGLTAEEQSQVNEVIALIDVLPSSEEAEQALAAYGNEGNIIEQERYLSEMQQKLEAAFHAFDALTEGQKAGVENAEKLQGLDWLLREQIMYPELSEDGAMVRELMATGVEITPTEAESLPAPGTVRNTDTIRYTFRVKTESYSEDRFGKGRVKLEFVLPLPADQATFNLADMAWLDSEEGYLPAVTTESRLIGDQKIACQVLTGYKLLAQQEDSGAVIPGEFTECVSVSVLDVADGQSVIMQVNAAMEHNIWDGVCQTHQIEEKLTVMTDPLTVVSFLPEEELQAIYAQFLAEVQELESFSGSDEGKRVAAEKLLERLQEAHQLGQLSDERFTELYERAFTALYGDVNTIAEAAEGTNWILLRDSGWFNAYSSYTESNYAESAYEQTAAASYSRALLANAADAASNDMDGATPAQPSDVQVTDRGGTNTSDDGAVSVSKTISGTNLENVFDITLQVQTSMNVAEISKEPDMAVVIVMDISNTMNSNFGGVTRYAAAMTAAENFLDQFAANNSLGISKVGYVAFNTDAHQIFGLQPCSTAKQANALKNTMRTQTGSIINAVGYKDSHSRFTNVEAGLAMASDMLNGVSNENKFIIFLSDGFPTTYIRSGYSGYDPYDSSGRFYDHVLKKPCSYGTSYSDEAAIRARNKAAAIKGSGTTIFSIGVDVAGQTIQEYITQSENANGFSVVDRTGTTYEIGNASSTEAYKNWLRESIGSGYYYDSTDSAGLTSAYHQIFEQIKKQVATGAVPDWVASDPLPTVNGVAKTVEFIGLYDKTQNLVSGELEGKHEENGENTAAYQSGSPAIRWDLKQSGYQTQTSSGTTTYTYTLTYRVRLENERNSFVEGTIYPTNDTTTLQYRTMERTDGNLTVSDPKTVEFPIPSVHGYLAELTFAKRDNRENPLSGAEFTLQHDTQNCKICRGDGTAVKITDQTATSGGDGAVSFTNIPSGHSYTLTETKVPDGYSSDGSQYQVMVAYDNVTVTVTTVGGTTTAWNGTIVNNTYYELPATGGGGTTMYTAGGLLITTAAVFLLYNHAKRRKGDGKSS